VICSSYEIVQRRNSNSGTTLRILIARQGIMVLSVIMQGGMGLKNDYTRLSEDTSSQASRLKLWVKKVLLDKDWSDG
jgi:hypothetical protein